MSKALLEIKKLEQRIDWIERYQTLAERITRQQKQIDALARYLNVDFERVELTVRLIGGSQ